MQIRRIALAAVTTAAVTAPTAPAMVSDAVSPSRAQAVATDAYRPAHLDSRRPGRSQSAVPVVTQVRAKDTGNEAATVLAGGLVLLAAILLVGSSVRRHRDRTSWA